MFHRLFRAVFGKMIFFSIKWTTSKGVFWLTCCLVAAGEIELSPAKKRLLSQRLLSLMFFPSLSWQQ
jgi:hypothetical protein